MKRLACTRNELRRVLLLFLACVVVAGLRAQDDTLAAQLEHIGRIAPDTAETFLDTLRRHVGRDERREVCAMLAYPLPHATGSLSTPADCESRYDSVFTLAVRKAIGTQRFQDLFVGEQGVMIGMGEVWFAGRCASPPCDRVSDLHVTAITSISTGLVPPKGKVLLACSVSGQRIRVSADGLGGASLSVWRGGRRAGAADLEFPRGTVGPPSGCASRSWTFDDGARTYVVSDLPCDAYLSPPPMGSVGRVTLSTPAVPGVPLWCVEDDFRLSDPRR